MRSANFFTTFVDMEEKRENAPTLNMKDRIRQLMDEVEMNQKDFSVVTGISQSTLSSIFSGRTSATLNHALALHSNFPRVRMEWLLFGEGEMYEQESKMPTSTPTSSPNTPAPVEGDLFSLSSLPDVNATPSAGQSRQNANPQNELPSQISNTLLNQLGTIEMELEVIKNNRMQRQISEIRIYFDDGTYQVFTP